MYTRRYPWLLSASVQHLQPGMGEHGPTGGVVAAAGVSSGMHPVHAHTRASS